MVIMVVAVVALVVESFLHQCSSHPLHFTSSGHSFIEAFLSPAPPSQACHVSFFVAAPLSQSFLHAPSLPDFTETQSLTPEHFLRLYLIIYYDFGVSDGQIRQMIYTKT